VAEALTVNGIPTGAGVCRAAACALTVAVASFVLAGCGGDGDDGGEATPREQTEPAATTATETPEPIVVELREVNNSGQSGTATLTPGSVGDIETFDVLIEIQPVVAAPQMAHVHAATCAEYAKVKGLAEQIATVRSNLSEIRDGKSKSHNVAGSIATGASSINVHEPAHPFPAVACGDIPRARR
jgi:hypothetical protein